MIPCPCSVCIETLKPHFFKYSTLKKRLDSRGKDTIECEISGEDILLQLLLDGFGSPRVQDPPLQDDEVPPPPSQSTKIINIFLASSSELEVDRQSFEIFINRQNNKYVDQGIYLKLNLWEDFPNAMSRTRLQDEYNDIIQNCDIFIGLFWTKVGLYTEEEFNIAFDSFQAHGKPLIFTYFKSANTSMLDLSEEEAMSFFSFRKKLTG